MSEIKEIKGVRKNGYDYVVTVLIKPDRSNSSDLFEYKIREDGYILSWNYLDKSELLVDRCQEHIPIKVVNALLEKA